MVEETSLCRDTLQKLARKDELLFLGSVALRFATYLIGTLGEPFCEPY